VVKEFFESVSGTAFLHRLVLAAHFSMTLLGPGSVRQVCQFLELTGLDRFVAASYGSQQKVSVAIEESVVDFGKKETVRMAKGMRPKEITVCQDETFHPQPCLVAIEPESYFIILEKYSEGRKGSDWTKAMNDVLERLPIKVVQSTSDEGKGILNHVKNELGAHHSPDLFHVQHEVVKATSAPLASKRKKAQMALEKASEAVNRRIDKQVAYENKGPQRGRPPQFDKRIENALEKETEALHALEVAKSHQKRMQDAIRRIGDAYHPVDLETGKLRSTEEVAGLLNQCFYEIETVACEAQSSEASFKRITKARKAVVDMIASIAFFLFTIRAKIEALCLAPRVEKAVLEVLIPALYIRRVAEKAKTADVCHRLRAKCDEMLDSLSRSGNPFTGLTQDELAVIERVAQECAGLFQRSSSCVEGRNGYLSLRHHGLHRLSNRKLSALTAVSNFYIKRRDGTTSAERFFGTKPKDLFALLLEKVDLPGRPAQKRYAPKERMPLIAGG
jgi:hypothetical protein